MHTSPSSPVPVTAAVRCRFPFAGLCLALALGALAPARAGILTGPVTSPVTGHMYYLLTQNTWTASQAEAVALGGNLATINDSAENDWVLTTFGNHGGSAKGLWIGLADRATEGTFAWTSGQAAAFRNWAAGECFVHLFEHEYNIPRFSS